jgi:hypothetical protein
VIWSTSKNGGVQPDLRVDVKMILERAKLVPFYCYVVLVVVATLTWVTHDLWQSFPW